jgi:phosphohistidine phosphatase
MMNATASRQTRYKTLYLLRHAKSSWSEPEQADFDRPLNKRGRKARYAMAQYMENKGYAPEIIICSTAKRAEMTLDAIRPVAPKKCEIRMDDGLYMADPKALAHRIQQVDPGVASVMMIGHNPGLHMLALALAQPSGSEDYGGLQIKYPTAALCVLRASRESWQPVEPKSYELLDFTVPRSLVAV